jgi:hypothetical protein
MAAIEAERKKGKRSPKEIAEGLVEAWQRYQQSPEEQSDFRYPERLEFFKAGGGTEDQLTRPEHCTSATVEENVDTLGRAGFWKRHNSGGFVLKYLYN